MQDLTTLMLLEKFKRRLDKIEIDKRAVKEGKDGAQGPKGDRGADGKQGPKGPVGPQGPKGPEGSKGSDGKEGTDGESGIGIVDAYTSADGDLVFVMSDDSELSVQMPLSTNENGDTIVYSQGGGSGGDGDVDLSEYVKRPVAVLRDGKWLVYRELADGTNEWAPATTDLIETNSAILFRDAKGRFKSVDVPDLKNQLEVNRWFLEQIEDGLQVQSDILLKVGELEISKGSVARYKVKGTSFAVATRAGELYVSSPNAEDVTTISLSAMDLNNIPTKPCNEDDIIEFDWPDGAVARYQVVSGVHDGLVVTYLSGTHTFEADQELETYVYPQNKGSASIEYVDAQDDKKLDKAGGTMTGDIAMSGKRVTGLADPTANAHAATKKYVDSLNHVPPSTGDVPTTTKLWKYMEGKNKNELQGDEFSIYFGSNDTVEVFIYPYIGGRWWAPASSTNYSHGIGECYATISDYSGAVALGFKAWKWWFIQAGTNSAGETKYHNCLQGDWLKLAYPEKYQLKDGHWYNLNFPSPFPLVKFPEEAHTGEQGSFGIDDEPDPLPEDAPDMGEVMP